MACKLLAAIFAALVDKVLGGMENVNVCLQIQTVDPFCFQ